MVSKKRRTYFAVFILFLIVTGMQACSSSKPTYIVIGERAQQAEINTAQHLKNDIEEVLQQPVEMINAGDEIPKSGHLIVVGTVASNAKIAELAGDQTLILSENFPGARGGIWAKVELANKQEAIVLAGSDVQGMQYAVYEYCKDILGIDAFEYWTGNSPATRPDLDLFSFQNKVIPPPNIPILCYFENDVDELANIKEPKLEYDWKNYTELINSLVRLKYNAIQLFDMLGRPEFFLRPEYKKVRPNYDVRISYIDSMINYAHDMGMMVQIDLALGYKFKPMDQEMADCWKNHKQDWLAAWRHYFEETPIGKADIFVLRPRNQVWDWEYKSSCGEDKIDVFNEVYAELGDLIDEYKPDAHKVVVCYSDGMQMYNQGFRPPNDWIVAWSDDGWGGFRFLPETTEDYQFGTYMHAGYWLNHTVHDPCPEKLDTIMKMMIDRYQADKYCLVNGQQFRPFLLNLEAFSKIADNPEMFNGKQFYTDWASRYFGAGAGKYAVDAMKKLHDAQYAKKGYVEHLWEVKEAVAYLSNSPIERPGKPPIPFDYELVRTDYQGVEKRLKIAERGLEIANEGATVLSSEQPFYHDYIQLPLQLYIDLLRFEKSLHHIAKLKRQFEVEGDAAALNDAIASCDNAREALRLVYDRCASGDKNPTWKGWYKVENRRPNNGFPTLEMLDDIEQNLKQHR